MMNLPVYATGVAAFTALFVALYLFVKGGKEDYESWAERGYRSMFNPTRKWKPSKRSASRSMFKPTRKWKPTNKP
jgi:hypothetical protein